MEAVLGITDMLTLNQSKRHDFVQELTLTYIVLLPDKAVEVFWLCIFGQFQFGELWQLSISSNLSKIQ